MPQVEADLIIEVGKTHENLKKTIALNETIDTQVKQIGIDSAKSFKKVASDVDSSNKNLEKGAGFLASLRQRIESLKERRELATTAEQARELTTEIRAAELQVQQLEGTVDQFGKRQKKGLAEVTDSFFAVGQGAIGALNLFNLLSTDGEQNSKALVTATRALVLAESARTVVLGLMKAQETAVLVAERIRALFIPKKTAAVIADTTATAGQIAMTRLFTVAEVQATVATKTFSAALAATPIGAIIVGLTLAIGLFSEFASKTNQVTEKQIKDFERLREIQDQITNARNQTAEAALKLAVAEGRLTQTQADRVREARRNAQEREKIENDQTAALQQIQKDFQDGAIKNEVDYQARREEILSRSDELIRANFLQHQDTLGDIDLQAKKEQQQRDNDLANLRISLIKNELDRVIKERIQKRDEELQKVLPLEKDAKLKRQLIEEKAARDILVIREKFGRDAVNLLIAQAEAEAALQQKILDSSSDIGTNLEKLQAQQNKSRVDLQNEFIKLLTSRENEIRDEGKRLGLATEAVEKNVQDALQKVRTVFNQLFANQEITFSRQLGEVERQNAEDRLAITRDSLEKRLLLFDISFAKEREKLIKANATATEIENARLKGINETIIKFESDRLAAQADIDKKRVERIEGAAGHEIETERQKNIEKLKLDIELAEAQLSLLLLFGDKQDVQVQQQIESFKTAIANAKREVKNLQGQVEPISWAEVFGIDEAHAAAFNESLEGFFSNVQNTISQALEFQLIKQDEMLDANKDLVDELTDQIKTLEDQLKDEEELNKRGLANNVDAKRKEIDALKAQRDRELEHQKQLLSERQKLARQQAIVNAGEQAGALITAGANLFKSLSTVPFGVGIALAIGFIASMVSAFASLKTQVAEATATPGFYDAGYTGDGHPREVAGNVHKKEFVFNHKKTTEYRELFEKIHKDQPLTTKDLLPLLEGTGVVIPEAVKDEITNTHTEIIELKSSKPSNELAEIKRELVEIKDNTANMQKRMDDSIESWQEPDGSTVLRQVKKGSEKIKRIRPNG